MSEKRGLEVSSLGSVPNQIKVYLRCRLNGRKLVSGPTDLNEYNFLALALKRRYLRAIVGADYRTRHLAESNTKHNINKSEHHRMDVVLTHRPE